MYRIWIDFVAMIFLLLSVTLSGLAKFASLQWNLYFTMPQCFVVQTTGFCLMNVVHVPSPNGKNYHFDRFGRDRPGPVL